MFQETWQATNLFSPVFTAMIEVYCTIACAYGNQVAMHCHARADLCGTGGWTNPREALHRGTFVCALPVITWEGQNRKSNLCMYILSSFSPCQTATPNAAKCSQVVQQFSDHLPNVARICYCTSSKAPRGLILLLPSQGGRGGSFRNLFQP